MNNGYVKKVFPQPFRFLAKARSADETYWKYVEEAT